MSEQEFDLEKFEKASYGEQLEMLMQKARAEKDIWMMLVIQDKLDELRKEKEFS
jgi:hypothetical protein